MEPSRAVCVKALEWCIDKYGLSKYHENYPKLVFCEKRKPREETLMGEYYWDSNLIYIYKKTHLNFEDPILELIFTVIHEYKHYLQNMKAKYNMYFDKYYYRYESHPYERTCNRFADREMYECYYYVVNKKKYPKAP